MSSVSRTFACELISERHSSASSIYNLGFEYYISDRWCRALRAHIVSGENHLQ